MRRYLEAGKLNSPRGIKGEIRFACYCDSPEFLSGVKRLYLDGEGSRYLEISLYRPSVPSIIFKGYEDRNLASSLNGRTVWFDRNDVELPEGTFYFDDMIGTEVFVQGTDGTIGKVTDVEEGVSSYFYIIKGEKSYRVPAVEGFVEKAVPEEGLWLYTTEGLEI